MVMIEMKDNAFEAAFDLLDEAKLNAKKTKLTLCELENAMYECYETSNEEKDGENKMDDIKFRGVSGYDKEYHDEDDEDTPVMRRLSHRRRSGMRRRLV